MCFSEMPSNAKPFEEMRFEHKRTYLLIKTPNVDAVRCRIYLDEKVDAASCRVPYVRIWRKDADGPLHYPSWGSHFNTRSRITPAKTRRSHRDTCALMCMACWF